jgi:hypothetical protein
MPIGVTVTGKAFRLDLRTFYRWSAPAPYPGVDDHDLAGGAASRAPLADHPFQARELGFRLVPARRAGGVPRAIRTDPRRGQPSRVLVTVLVEEA